MQPVIGTAGRHHPQGITISSDSISERQRKMRALLLPVTRFPSIPAADSFGKAALPTAVQACPSHSPRSYLMAALCFAPTPPAALHFRAVLGVFRSMPPRLCTLTKPLAYAQPLFHQ